MIDPQIIARINEQLRELARIAGDRLEEALKPIADRHGINFDVQVLITFEENEAGETQ